MSAVVVARRRGLCGLAASAVALASCAACFAALAFAAASPRRRLAAPGRGRSQRFSRVPRCNSSPRRDSTGSDWRDFRASLVAREKREERGQQSDTSDANGREQPGWAYPTPLIEQGSVLLSEPGCGFSFQQQYFQKAVILLVNHNDNHDMGIILNRPTSISTSSLGLRGDRWPIGFGGDCQGFKDTPPGQLDAMCMFCLHNLPALADESKTIVDGLYFTHLPRARAAVEQGIASDGDFLVAAGYCGWGPGQLQREIDAGGFWSLAAVDKRSLVRELKQAQARAALEVAAGDEYQVDDGIAAWQRLYHALGKDFQAAAGTRRPDVMFADQMLRDWIQKNLVRVDRSARGRSI